MSQSTTTTLGGSPLSIASGLHGRHLTRRLVQLYVGLTLYGASSALLVRSGLGLEPWGVLHQGLAEKSGLTIGVVSIVVGAVVLLLWIPIRQRPGLGTVSNVFVIGLAMDGTLALVPEVHGLAGRIPLLVLGILLNGVATGLYIAARFGPGPRDGLMTGLHRLTGRSIRLVRTAIEIAVVATGFLLGGSVGIGTVLYALAIGPLAQFFLRWFAVPEPETAPGGAAGVVVAAGTASAREADRLDAAPEPGPGPSAVAPATPEQAILRP
ncbi:YitT family protein [Streptomyces sp. NPDC093089]|uniref:membrane protein YczE n=1 Tax=Streptomyces sp. NPDC093089 TaxID=3366024 RepID=UPI003814BB31